MTGRGIFETQGMSGEGGASRGDGEGDGSEVDMMSEALLPELGSPHLSHSPLDSAEEEGEAASSGLFLLTSGSEVGLGFGCGIGSVLASLVAALTFISAKVIVPCVLVATAFAAAGVEDTFLEGTGELTDDLREAAGLPREVFLLMGPFTCDVQESCGS